MLALKLWSVLQEMALAPAALFSVCHSSSWVEFFLPSSVERMTIGAENYGTGSKLCDF